MNLAHSLMTFSSESEPMAMLGAPFVNVSAKTGDGEYCWPPTSVSRLGVTRGKTSITTLQHTNAFHIQSPRLQDAGDYYREPHARAPIDQHLPKGLVFAHVDQHTAGSLTAFRRS